VARGAARGESSGTDFTNKCRRLNPGMLQDGSLPLNRRLSAASYLPPRVAACRSFVPPYRHTSPSPRPPPQPPPRFRSRPSSFAEAPPTPPTVPFSPVLVNLPHADAAATVSLSLTSLSLSLRESHGAATAPIGRNPKKIAGSIDEGHACRSSETEPAHSRDRIRFALD